MYIDVKTVFRLAVFLSSSIATRSIYFIYLRFLSSVHFVSKLSCLPNPIRIRCLALYWIEPSRVRGKRPISHTGVCENVAEFTAVVLGNFSLAVRQLCKLQVKLNYRYRLTSLRGTQRIRLRSHKATIAYTGYVS